MGKVFTTDQLPWVNANGTNEAKTRRKKTSFEAIRRAALVGIFPSYSEESSSFQTAGAADSHHAYRNSSGSGISKYLAVCIGKRSRFPRVEYKVTAPTRFTAWDRLKS
jgi:hypothetical protein